MPCEPLAGVRPGTFPQPFFIYTEGPASAGSAFDQSAIFAPPAAPRRAILLLPDCFPSMLSTASTSDVPQPETAADGAVSAASGTAVVPGVVAATSPGGMAQAKDSGGASPAKPQLAGTDWSLWKMPPERMLVIAGVAGITLWAYWTTLVRLEARWSAESEHSHGYIVPVISVFLLWLRSENYDPRKWKGSAWGLLLIAFALAMRLVGERYLALGLHPLSLVPCLAGIFLTAGGWGAAMGRSVDFFPALHDSTSQFGRADVERSAQGLLGGNRLLDSASHRIAGGDPRHDAQDRQHPPGNCGRLQRNESADDDVGHGGGLYVDRGAAASAQGPAAGQRASDRRAIERLSHRGDWRPDDADRKRRGAQIRA